MKFEDELKNLPSLQAVGSALAAYCITLIPGLALTRNEKGKYVTEPHNFVTFTVHWQRTSKISVTIRGNPFEFALLPELPLKRDQNGYSAFKTSPHCRSLTA
jgi:hypothetical protein